VGHVIRLAIRTKNYSEFVIWKLHLSLPLNSSHVSIKIPRAVSKSTAKLDPEAFTQKIEFRYPLEFGMKDQDLGALRSITKK